MFGNTILIMEFLNSTYKSTCCFLISQHSGVLCDQRIPTRLKENFYMTAIRPAMTCGAECRLIKKQRMHKMNLAKMRMLMWMW